MDFFILHTNFIVSSFNQLSPILLEITVLALSRNDLDKVREIMDCSGTMPDKEIIYMDESTAAPDKEMIILGKSTAIMDMEITLLDMSTRTVDKGIVLVFKGQIGWKCCN